MLRREGLGQNLTGGESNMDAINPVTGLESESAQTVQNPIALESTEPYVPQELVLRIIEESIKVVSGNTHINLSILLCCRAWLDLALSVIWKHIVIKTPRVATFLNSLTLCSTITGTGMTYLQCLNFTGDQSALRKLKKHLFKFDQLQHLSLTQSITHDHHSRYDIIVDDLILKLPLSVRSIELIIPTLGFSKRCDHFCQTLKAATKQLHSLRIFLKEWVMADALARLREIWTQTYQSLQHFSFVMPLGTSRLDACDPVRQMQFLREIATLILEATGNGKLPNLKLCRISAYRGKIQSPDRWRKAWDRDDRSTTIDAIQNKVFSFPLLRLSEKRYECEDKGLPGLFWTQKCIDRNDLRGSAMATLNDVDPSRLMNILGTMDDLMNMWEGKKPVSYGQTVNAQDHASNVRYKEIMSMLTEEEVKFMRDREEDSDPSRLPRIEPLV